MALPADLAQRISCAKNDRAKHQNAINDFLRFADPVRPRIGDSSGTVRSDEADDLYNGKFQETAEDFASDTRHSLIVEIEAIGERLSDDGRNDQRE